MYKIDKDGYYIGIEEVTEIDEFCIHEPMAQGYVCPKWNGSEWIEGATPEEIEAWQESQQVESQPTETEILQQAIAELSIVAAQNQQSIAELSMLQMEGGAADVQ